MEKINYFQLFVKAIVFALIVLALKTFFNGVARADEFTEILNTGYTPVSNTYIIIAPIKPNTVPIRGYI